MERCYFEFDHRESIEKVCEVKKQFFTTLRQKLRVNSGAEITEKH
jgi:hypothetical protein